MKPRINVKLFLMGMIICLISCNTQTASNTPTIVTDSPYSGPTNKDMYDIINSGNWARVDSVVDKDGIDHTAMGDIKSRDSLLLSLKQFKTAFPDARLEAMDEVVHGDLIYTRYHLTATNTGPMGAQPPTNKKIDIIGIDLARVKNGKLYEHWDYSDNLQFYKQLGINPFAPPSSKK